MTIDPLSPGITPTVIPVDGIGTGGSGTEFTVVTADPVTVPAELVALIVYAVDVAGDTTLIPTKPTRPIPWSMLTDVAPVTFQNKVDGLPELIAGGLLLNSVITGGVPTDGLGFGDGAENVKQPGMRNSNNSDREIKTNLFNVCTS